MKAFVLLICIFISLSGSAQFPDENSRISNEFMVMLRAGYTGADLLKDFPGANLKKCVSPHMNIWLLSRSTTSGSEEFLDSLRANKMVKVAQFNHRVQQRSLVPSDPFFSQQWNMLNTGQNGGIAGDDIAATDAWGINHNNITARGDTIVVATVDVGFDLAHQDLNFFVNYHEIPGNGIDDDSDGYVDDYLGWNVFTQSDYITEIPDDHSMHVSGIAGAISNNLLGVAGVCWGAQIMRICGSTGDEADVIAAYEYCLVMRRIYNSTRGAKGAFVVSTNSSFGVDYGNPADYPLWCAMYDSMGTAGILSAAATANHPINVDIDYDIPTACPSKWLIKVTNTTNADNLHGSAAYGKASIDLGAPGTNILSTETNNGYGSMTGTSMASPHLAGTVAAMFAAACPKLIDDYRVFPDSIALFVKQMIMDGTMQVSSLYNRTVTGGRLNLYHAIENLAAYNCGDCSFSVADSVRQPKCSNSCDGSIQLTTYPVGNYTYQWGSSSGNTNFLQNLCAGVYSVSITDTTGCVVVKNATLVRPDSIVISSVKIVQPDSTAPGSIVIAATAGNYQLQYSIDNLNYQQTPVFSISKNADYYVYVKNEPGCIVKQGVYTLIGLNELNIYPVPATTVLKIAVNPSQDTSFSYTVTNLLGQRISQGSMEISSGAQIIDLNIASIQAGIYFLRTNTSGLSGLKTIIIAR